MRFGLSSTLQGSKTGAVKAETSEKGFKNGYFLKTLPFYCGKVRTGENGDFRDGDVKKRHMPSVPVQQL